MKYGDGDLDLIDRLGSPLRTVRDPGGDPSDPRCPSGGGPYLPQVPGGRLAFEVGDDGGGSDLLDVHIAHLPVLATATLRPAPGRTESKPSPARRSRVRSARSAWLSLPGRPSRQPIASHVARSSAGGVAPGCSAHHYCS